MISIKVVYFSVIFSLFIFSSCSNKIDNNQAQSTEVKKHSQPLLQNEYLGNYHGIQLSYTMKNQYGDDMIIGGQKVSVPSIDFKFLLKEDGIAGLQQTNLDDNSRVYYNGTFKILNEDANTVTVECSLSDGEYSNPKYILKINNSDKSAVCNGTNEPEFIITKI
jgi:hypothetical protein|tara:strand:+ start:662 stop:1153 length:492 start_codon:yes stop_codon:yes gene_type:complete